MGIGRRSATFLGVVVFRGPDLSSKGSSLPLCLAKLSDTSEFTRAQGGSQLWIVPLFTCRLCPCRISSSLDGNALPDPH